MRRPGRGPRGLVVLRGHGEDAALDRVSIVSAIGLEGPDGEIPAAAEQPITASLRAGGPPRSTTLDRVPARGGALALRLRAQIARLLTLVSQGEQAVDRADATRPSAESRNDAAQRSRAPAVGRRGNAGGPVPPRAPWASTSAETGTTSSSSRTARSASSSATSSARRAGRRDDGPASQRPPRVRLRVRRSTHRRLAARQARRGDDRLRHSRRWWYLVVDPRQRRARYVVAGHPPP